VQGWVRPRWRGSVTWSAGRRRRGAVLLRGPPRHGGGQRRRGSRPASSPPWRGPGPASARAAAAAACARAASCCASRTLCSASAAPRKGLVPAGLSDLEPLAGLGACLTDRGVPLHFGAVNSARTPGRRTWSPRGQTCAASPPHADRHSQLARAGQPGRVLVPGVLRACQVATPRCFS
jgi:hypothetical protein